MKKLDIVEGVLFIIIGIILFGFGVFLFIQEVIYYEELYFYQYVMLLVLSFITLMLCLMGGNSIVKGRKKV